ncbi:MAG: hypothetical protein MO852_16750, partial [Candidatus Devosia euplotis]|nr:hypothetical protein [Candidatus Devosia euplotis]
ALLLNVTMFSRWKLGRLFRSLILVPWVTPPVVAVAAWKWLLDVRYDVVNQALMGLGLIDQGIPFLARTSTVWGHRDHADLARDALRRHHHPGGAAVDPERIARGRSHRWR